MRVVHVCGGNKLHTAFLFGEVNKQDMKNCGKMQLECRNNGGYYMLCSCSVSSVWVPKVNPLLNLGALEVIQAFNFRLRIQSSNLGAFITVGSNGL